MAFLPSRGVSHHTVEMIESWRFIPGLTSSKQLWPAAPRDVDTHLGWRNAHAFDVAGCWPRPQYCPDCTNLSWLWGCWDPGELPPRLGGSLGTHQLHSSPLLGWNQRSRDWARQRDFSEQGLGDHHGVGAVVRGHQKKTLKNPIGPSGFCASPNRSETMRNRKFRQFCISYMIQFFFWTHLEIFLHHFEKIFLEKSEKIFKKSQKNLLKNINFDEISDFFDDFLWFFCDFLRILLLVIFCDFLWFFVWFFDDFLMIFWWFLMIFWWFFIILEYFPWIFRLSTEKILYLRAQMELWELPQHKPFTKTYLVMI